MARVFLSNMIRQWRCRHRRIAWMPDNDMRKFCMDCGKIFGEPR
jgi:hypothetical protein